jgi:uncharacterized protein (TIGR03067 family)
MPRADDALGNARRMAMGITVLVLALLTADPDAPDKALQGTWVVTTAQREGKDAADVVGHRLKIDGDRFEIREGDKLLFRGTLAIDKSAGKLWQVDIKHSHGDLAGKKWLGVMRVRDDGVLVICDNAVDPEKPRPEALESKPGSGTILLEFRRPEK